MTIMNFVTEDQVNAKKIEEIRTERDQKISMIDEQFKFVDQKFKLIYGRSINNAIQNDHGKYAEAAEKGKEILAKFSNKKQEIQKIAEKAIEEIKAAEKAALINELDNLVNEICG